MKKKADYVIINSNGEYFTEFSKNNIALFTASKNEASKLTYDETETTVPLIELNNKCLVYAEQY